MPSWFGTRLKQVRTSSGQLGVLMRHSPRLGRLVVKNIPIWDSHFGTEFRMWLVELCVTFRHRDACVYHFIDSLPDLLNDCGNFHRQRFMRSFMNLCMVNQTAEHVDDWVMELWNVLPALIVQFDDEWILEWVQKSNADGDNKTSLEAALSHLRLDSAKSHSDWKAATGRVYLKDLQSRLWPYMESHLGDWQGAVKIQASNRAFTDGIDIFLPTFIEGQDAFGWTEYRVWVARLSALFEFGSFEFDLSSVLSSPPVARDDELLLERFFRSFPDQRLARALFFMAEEHRVAAHLSAVYPGVADKVLKQRQKEALTAASKPKSSLLMRLMSEVQQLFSSLDLSSDVHPILSPHQINIRNLSSAQASVTDSILLMQGLFQNLYALNLKSDMRDAIPYSIEQTTSRRKKIRLQAEKSTTTSISLPQAQKRAATDSGDVFEQLQFLTDNPMGEGTLLSDRTTEPSPLKPEFVVDGVEVAGGQYRYPEWDMQLMDVRPNWTLVRELTVQSTASGTQFCERTQQEHGQEMRKIRSIFQMLKDNLSTRKRGLEDGDRLEFDRWLDSRIQRKLRQTPDTNLYSRIQHSNRDPAIAFLVDLSSSTNEITKDAVPILDIEKAALLLMAEALHSIGDPFAIFGYSGFGKDQVAFYIAKDVDEPWTEKTKTKVGSMGWKMENRDGAAIRHVVQKMSDWPQQQRILLLLSDGKPLDCGDKYYFDAYAQADTRAALLEARENGITPFCITVDPYGQEYLPYMYGPHGFVSIDNMQNFSHQLAKVYAAMTL